MLVLSSIGNSLMQDRKLGLASGLIADLFGGGAMVRAGVILGVTPIVSAFLGFFCSSDFFSGVRRFS